MIIPFIEQKQMMHDRPSRDTHAPRPIRTPLLDLRHEPTASLPADRRLPPEEYEDLWEQQFINHLARQICEDTESRSRQRYEQPEEEGRRRQAESRKQDRKKAMSKYKAYAVKMKIPSYHEITRPKREAYKGETVQFRPRAEPRPFIDPVRGIYEPQSLSRMEEVFRANIRDIAIANLFDSNNSNIFKKRPTKGGNKNTVIRKRSIKTTDKRREQEDAKVSLNKFLKTSTSPKIGKKCVISLDQSSLEPAEANSTSMNQPKKVEACKSKKGFMFVKSPIKSPQKDKEQRSGVASREGREGLDSTTKLLEKVDRAIHFKKKDKVESPAKAALRQHPSQKAEKSLRMELVPQPSKTLIRTIYTSKDVIRNKSNLAKETREKEAEQRRQVGNQKVFVFNSEDNYIKRMLVQAGWINNHDHRSHFYHLKWVFKPDAIDYNLKPDQFVNHVKNSHELTSKHYLNKNLKAFLSSWPTLYSVYPHSYDFAKPAEKQDFYTHFKKEIMMNLLQNIYEYMLSSRPEKVHSFTKFYQSLLGDNGSYNTCEAQASSPLRKKHFRKIDMEDYRQYDPAFLVHMNLLVVALKYWRGLRKEQELQPDDQQHFLAFREKEFQENLPLLQRYSKMHIGYSPQSGFESEFYATPSEIAIGRVVKEYVYFERQLGRQWRVFGRGNIWIVKPCSASRGTGIYLANDCAQILTDTRGIQSKIVQRYIQRPLILREGIGRGRKFDLRQWVLLRSVQPLQIYMFSHCYLRVCSEQFIISNIHNLKAHLTNYSFNKRHFQQPGESVIDQDAFQHMLLHERRVNFKETVRPKIKDIIIQSIKSTQHLISDCGQACFSLLGYDILLDDDCEPWLLQVNMSPACKERTDWLRTYLDVMGRDLLKIVLPETYINNPVKPSGRGSELPSRKQWQLEGGLELKKMKTEISQSGQQEETTSYVNAIFDLNPSKIQLEPLESQLVLDGNSAYGSDQSGQRLILQDFITEKWVEREEGAIQEQERANKPSNAESLSALDAKFANLQLYLDDPRDKLLISSPEKLIPPSPLTQSPDLSPSKPNQNPSQLSLMKLESQLKWEKICYQDYPGGRKDGETHFEITGAKITPTHLYQIDRAIENAEAQREEITQSCIMLQTAIRGFLTAKQAQRKASIEKASLKLNVARLAKNDIRQSKSALYNHEEKTWNFDRNSGALSKLERPITARNGSNPPSAKHRGGDSFREKIRSIAMQAACRQSCSQEAFRMRQRQQLISQQATPTPAVPLVEGREMGK